jgi:hypothetical protein
MRNSQPIEPSCGTRGGVTGLLMAAKMAAAPGPNAFEQAAEFIGRGLRWASRSIAAAKQGGGRRHSGDGNDWVAGLDQSIDDQAGRALDGGGQTRWGRHVSPLRRMWWSNGLRHTSPTN